MIKLTEKNFGKYIDKLIYNIENDYDGVVNYINNAIYENSLQCRAEEKSIYYIVARLDYRTNTLVNSKHFDIIKKQIEFKNKGFIRFEFEIYTKRREWCKRLNGLFDLRPEEEIKSYNAVKYNFIMPISTFNNLLTLVKTMK